MLCCQWCWTPAVVSTDSPAEPRSEGSPGPSVGPGLGSWGRGGVHPPGGIGLTLLRLAGGLALPLSLVSPLLISYGKDRT